MSQRIAFVAAQTEDAQAAHAALVAHYGDTPLAEADVIVALGGDGFMLRTLHRHMSRGVPVYGMKLGTVGFLRIAAWSLFSSIYGPHWPLIGATVGLSLIGIVLWGSLMGSMLPLIIKRCGFDPASSSAPFIATLVDVTGLVIYFTVAVMILRGTLL